MVQINPEDSTKLSFRKLKDPQDSPFLSIYKHCFRYASPNLFIWGPLAPAHDALIARDFLARIQLGSGILLFFATFIKLPFKISKLRLRFFKFTTFFAGLSLFATAANENSYIKDPNSNPLFIEIQLARELSILNPDNKGKINKGSYWFGPNNFMPMNNEQYWKMIYSIEVNRIMSNQYFESSLMKKYSNILQKTFIKNDDNNDTDLIKGNELTKNIENIINHNDLDDKNFNVLDNSLILKNKNFPLINKDLSNFSNAKTLLFWSTVNPFEMLQVQEYREFYAHEFPRLQPTRISTETNISK